MSRTALLLGGSSSSHDCISDVRLPSSSPHQGKESARGTSDPSASHGMGHETCLGRPREEEGDLEMLFSAEAVGTS